MKEKSNHTLFSEKQSPKDILPMFYEETQPTTMLKFGMQSKEKQFSLIKRKLHEDFVGVCLLPGDTVLKMKVIQLVSLKKWGV